MSDARTDLADAVSALVDPIRHAETCQLRSAYPDGRAVQEIRIWRTVHPSLLDQLAAAIEPSGNGDGTVRGYESAPSANLDAIYVRMRIEAAGVDWLRQLRQPLRETIQANLRALVGLTLAQDVLTLLAKDAGRWVSWARIVTRWDVPPRRIPAPCMACDVQDSLRVRDVRPMEATCFACGEVWREEDGTIWNLGAYVKWFNGEMVTDVTDTGELERIGG